PTELHIAKGAITIAFTQPIDSATAGDPDSYNIEHWNYIWSKEYGSPEVHVDDPTQKGHEPVEVKAVEVSPDHKSVTLKIPELRPVMQMSIQMKIDAADGAPIEYTIFNTINLVPGYLPHSQPQGNAPAATRPAPATSQPADRIVAAPSTQASTSH